MLAWKRKKHELGMSSTILHIRPPRGRQPLQCRRQEFKDDLLESALGALGNASIVVPTTAQIKTLVPIKD